MMAGFTKTGQPIMGRHYRIVQGDLDISAKVVGKLYGKSRADLVGVIFEEESGARGSVPWPLEAEEGAPPISITPTTGEDT